MKKSYSSLFLAITCLALACGGGGDNSSDAGSSTSFEDGTACDALGFQKTAKVLNGEVCSLDSSGDTSSVVKVELLANDAPSGVCTGTIIAPRAVLTAAHCFLASPSGVAIVTGVRGTRTRVVASSVVTHPGFFVNRDGFFINDVAVIRFSSDLPAPSTPLLLSRSASAGERAVVAGFGQTAPSSSTTDDIYAGSASIRSVSDSYIRIDYTQGESHPCRGDSGGALFVDSGDSLAIVGIVSQSDPSVPVSGICKVGDKTLYTSVESENISSFITSLVPDADVR